ncbi:MAG: tRNA pseudouridine(38-40) synthase TruA [Bacteroidales bacterium]|nr:tRNA pseudouridine(38-40) synthase TruA [Bacteroidales bacterium]
MKNRYLIHLSYKGTAYHGWQIQNNGITIQGVLQEKLSLITREEIEITGCGRTDTGVHARNYIAHFDSNLKLENDKLVGKLNKILPVDIAIHEIRKVREGFHARFDATYRTYKYYIGFEKDAFANDLAWFMSTRPDVAKMNEAAKVLFDYEDFTSFAKLHTDVKTNNCKIMKAEWQEYGGKLVFEITADRFLRNMVRAIVGTLILVGKGKISIEDFRKIIEAKDRSLAGTSAPACGLFLEEVGY